MTLSDLAAMGSFISGAISFTRFPCGEDAKIKAATMRDLWVPGVNELGGFGRWEIAEFCDWAVMDEDFAALVMRIKANAS